MARAIIFKDFNSFQRYVKHGHASEGSVSFEYVSLSEAKGGGLCFNLGEGKPSYIVNNRQLIALEGVNRG